MMLRTRPYFPAVEDRFDRAFHHLTSSLLTASSRTPAVDVAWQDGALQLTVDLPGTPEDAIHVEVAGRRVVEPLVPGLDIRPGGRVQDEAHVVVRRRRTIAAGPAPEQDGREDVGVALRLRDEARDRGALRGLHGRMIGGC